MQALTKTAFNFPKQTSVYKGKVRDVYTINNELLVMVVTDRISAFDVVLPEGIPYKGQVLNQIASKFLDATRDIVPNWKMATPDPMVMIGKYCEPYPVEMIIRGYLTGSSWRTYKKGHREICGVSIPNGMREHQKFDQPILTPTTKAQEGHDEDISREEIIRQNLVPEDEYMHLERYTRELFKRGSTIAGQHGLILVDTKYEFGRVGKKIFLIDEIHTPDSSRYFYKDGYEERFQNDQAQRQLSKEFVREWLMEKDFQGKEGQKIPDLPEEFIASVSERYIELYEKITGEAFEKADISNVSERVEHNINEFLKQYFS
ncbi:MAG: phosphoribosylaminoimidazolesuccinocarboxamide synthase [Bacteroidales bacterium]